MEPSWASKIDPGSPGWPQDPPKSEPNLDPINRNFEAQVGLHFGGVLAAMWRHRALFPGMGVGPGFSLCWRPKAFPRPSSDSAVANFFVEKYSVFRFGGLKNTRNLDKNLGRLRISREKG